MNLPDLREAGGRAFRAARAAYDFALEVGAEYAKDQGPTLAAALAFYAAFSLFPLLLGLIAVAANFVSPEQAQDIVFRYSTMLLASQRDFLAGTVRGVVEARGTLGVLAAIVLLWSGKNLFLALEDTLERVYEMRRLGGIWGTVWANARAMAFTVLTSMAVVAVAALVWGLQAVLAFDLPWLPDVPRHRLQAALDLFQIVLPSLTAGGGLVLLYRYLPARRLAWRQAILSACVAAVLWQPVSLALAWYLGEFARLNAVYGPISGVMGFYLWLNLTGSIVILAAEIGAVYCRRVSGVKSSFT
ncbi:MAG: YihY/virulence factor BrkB family protein [Candidatus Sericytochromatia bacterium]|nr:YihY/virulence factor BrkB family protein [Candidatus Tanganyikabacteria bacterium]